MKYKQFINGVQKLADHPVPDVWSRVERSTTRGTVLAFPRLRLIPVAALVGSLLFLQVGISVAQQLERQQMYAYLEPLSVTEYASVANAYY